MNKNEIKMRQPLLRFSLCLCLLVIFALVASCALNVVPDPLIADLTECQTFTTNLGHIGQDCATGPFTYFYWLADSPPPWVILDENTGELTACPPPGSAGVYNFSVGVTELWPAGSCISRLREKRNPCLRVRWTSLSMTTDFCIVV